MIASEDGYISVPPWSARSLRRLLFLVLVGHRFHFHSVNGTTVTLRTEATCVLVRLCSWLRLDAPGKLHQDATVRLQVQDCSGFETGGRTTEHWKSPTSYAFLHSSYSCPPPSASSPPPPLFPLHRRLFFLLSLLILLLLPVSLFPFHSCRWTRNLLSLLSSYNLTVSIPCHLFPRFSISCSTCINHRVLCQPMGLFPSNFNSSAFLNVRVLSVKF